MKSRPLSACCRNCNKVVTLDRRGRVRLHHADPWWCLQDTVCCGTGRLPQQRHEVHPMPARRAVCLYCGKTVPLSRKGCMASHLVSTRNRCVGSGVRPPPARILPSSRRGSK